MNKFKTNLNKKIKVISKQAEEQAALHPYKIPAEGRSKSTTHSNKITKNLKTSLKKEGEVISQQVSANPIFLSIGNIQTMNDGGTTGTIKNVEKKPNSVQTNNAPVKVFKLKEQRNKYSQEANEAYKSHQIQMPPKQITTTFEAEDKVTGNISKRNHS